MLLKGTLSLDYYLQRPSEQWDRYKKSLWIHTLITNLPKYPIFTRKENDVYYVLEGKQRIDTFVSFMNNGFSLSKETPDVVDDELGETYKIGGLRFNKFPESLKNALVNNSILHYNLEGTDEEIENFFDRINNGVALTPQQQAKAKMGKEWALTLNKVNDHPFFKEKCNFSKAQLRHSDSEVSILSFMMLIDPDYELKGLSNGLVARYATSLKGSNNKLPLVGILNSVLDYLYSALTEPLGKNLSRKMNLTSLLSVGNEAIKNKIDRHKFNEWVLEFEKYLAGEETKIVTNYKEYGGQGSVKTEKVLGRIDEMFKSLKQSLTASSPSSKKPKSVRA